MNDFDIVIPSNRIKLAYECSKSLYPYNAVIYNISFPNGNSYAKLMNWVITNHPSELIMICNDKGRPKPEHVKKVLKLLDMGYGMAWLHPYGFGGFYKDVIRKIGFYDERYIDGNYEDCDISRRLKEANIALYESFEIEWLTMKSSWEGIKSKHHFQRKWKDFKRMMPEESYNYNIGNYLGRKFLSWDNTHSSSAGNK